jgi:hypothetical protein
MRQSEGHARNRTGFACASPTRLYQALSFKPSPKALQAHQWLSCNFQTSSARPPLQCQRSSSAQGCRRHRSTGHSHWTQSRTRGRLGSRPIVQESSEVIRQSPLHSALHGRRQRRRPRSVVRPNPRLAHLCWLLRSVPGGTLPERSDHRFLVGRLRCSTKQVIVVGVGAPFED